MPAVILPRDLIKKLEESQSGKIDGTQGPGVAGYLPSVGNARVDVYVGLELDGVKLYQNITSMRPDIAMQFALRPVILCQSDVLTFEPDKDNTITIQVL